VGRLDDGDALNLSRAEIAEYFARRTQSPQRKAALRFRQLRPLAEARRVLAAAHISARSALSARDTRRSPRETSGLVRERIDIALDGG
jgi:hypothetical protein